MWYTRVRLAGGFMELRARVQVQVQPCLCSWTGPTKALRQKSLVVYNIHNASFL